MKLLIDQPAGALRHVLSADQYDTRFIDHLFTNVDRLRVDFNHSRRFNRIGNTLAGLILYRLFYKESTRTYESFGFAATHLGMSVLGTQTVQFSSVSKGETLEDTIRTICSYRPSVIVLRSEAAGDAKRAAAVSSVPVINAGDGSGEHPTQALLDLYTIREETGRTDKLRILMGGDLWNGRTVRSLTKLLALYPGNHFTFVAPEPFRMQPDILKRLDQAGISYDVITDPRPAITKADVVYWTRVQKERATPTQQAFLTAHPKIEEQFVLTLADVRSMKPSARVLHPLPRVGEIKPEVDADPRAAYIRQMHYGMLVRMALIEWITGSD